MRWFRINFNDRIEPVEVIRETAHLVVLKDSFTGGRAQRSVHHEDSSWESFHKTFTDAKNHLIEVTKNRIDHLDEQLKGERNRLTKLEALEEPK